MGLEKGKPAVMLLWMRCSTPVMCIYVCIIHLYMYTHMCISFPSVLHFPLTLMPFPSPAFAWPAGIFVGHIYYFLEDVYAKPRSSGGLGGPRVIVTPHLL